MTIDLRAVRNFLRRAPWWAVSAVMHLVVLGLAMTIGYAVRQHDDGVICVLELQSRPLPPKRLSPRPEPRRGVLDEEPPAPEGFIDGQPIPDEPPESADDDPSRSVRGRPDVELSTTRNGLAEGPLGNVLQALHPGRAQVMGVGGGGGSSARFGDPHRGGLFDRFPVGRRRAAPAATEDAVRAGLRWLARHQEPDGGWPAAFDGACAGGSTCSGRGAERHEVGLTALALLAFLGAGHVPSSREAFEDPLRPGRMIRHGDVVLRGLRWLKDRQDPEGSFARQEGEFLYDHAIALLAMTEAAALSGSPLYREPARQGVAFLERARNPGSAWRYSVRPGESDTSVTGWCVMALKSAELCGIEFDREAYRGVLAWLDRVTSARGVVGYASPGDAGSVITGVNEAWQIHPAMTAVGLLSRIYIERRPGDPWLHLAAQEIVRDLPAWDTEHRTVDYYYWYYSALALFQYDAPNGPAWKAFNAAMQKALLPHQVRRAATCADGSWSPEPDRWGTVGGRVYATAMNVLTLEVYYRYPSVFTGARK